MTEQTTYDCIVVGGGPAGLGAASTLARLNHSVLVLDSGVYRNAAARHMHNVLGWDHRDPAEFRAKSRADIAARYENVKFADVAASKVNPQEGGSFEVVDDRDGVHRGRKIVLATGIRDIMPDIPGYKECWARGIFHCMLCHGYEDRGGESVGVLATGYVANPPVVVHMTHSASQFAEKVVIYTHGAEDIAARTKGALNKQTDRIEYETRKITGMRMAEPESADDTKVIVTLEDGTERVERFVTHVPSFELNGPWVEQLGLELNETGEIKTTPPLGQTSVPGVFAAGDNMTQVRFVMNAAVTGGTAGAGIAFMVEMETLQ